MYSDRIEKLISAALISGNLTEKSKQILFRNAQEEGIDLDEFEMVLNARIYEMQEKNTQSTNQNSAHKSNKLGEIRKCPACGAIIVEGLAVCQECGYAFNNIGTGKTIERLFDELQAIGKKEKTIKGVFMNLLSGGVDTTAKKMALISTFPIPNEKSELLDTLSSIQSLSNSKGAKDGILEGDFMPVEDLSYAYWKMYCNCINKAKISFANDIAFKPYFDFYEKELNKSDKKKRFGLF
ncbi:MAG: hypothetical protein IKV32_05025 [Muribaculaceae bacterium]|nr:hypothetical protein [Muribaculaceae bacterium]